MRERAAMQDVNLGDQDIIAATAPGEMPGVHAPMAAPAFSFFRS